MAFLKSKLGTVTWVDSSKGAFIEELSENDMAKNTKQSFSPASQVFVPIDLIKSMKMEIKEGMMVQYEEEDNVATKVETLYK